MYSWIDILIWIVVVFLLIGGVGFLGAGFASLIQGVPVNDAVWMFLVGLILGIIGVVLGVVHWISVHKED